MELSVKMGSVSVSVDDLIYLPYSYILCYPNPNENIAKFRVECLKKIGVERIIFEGKTQIGKLNVLGKGCVGIVVKGIWCGKNCALKIRRVDANRESLKNESEILKMVNNVNIGPKLFHSSQDFLIMEFIDGANIIEWVKGLKGKGSIIKLKFILRDIIEQCYTLDKLGIDHGELSNLKKHILIRDKAIIIDFETASFIRRTSNLTSSVQYLYIGGPIANRIRRLIKLKDVNEIVNALREYKRLKNEESYKNLLKCLRLYKLSK
ncbi:MAG: hypothetical protein QW372_03990 [Nitrososphaerales archaeon]